MQFSKFPLLFKTFKSQSGAMFGMDARIALIVASVMAAAVGVTLMNKADRDRVDNAERAALAIRDAILDHYETQGINQFVPAIEDLFNEGLIPNSLWRQDPWGGAWQYTFVTEEVELEGTPVPIQYAVVFSAGQDGIANSDLIVSGYDYRLWEAKNDDIGVKISSRDIERERLEEYRARGQLIVDKLQNVETTHYLEAVANCDGSSPATWCEDFEGKDQSQFNFYPKSDLDDLESVAYYVDAKGGGTTYSAGDINDMEQLMTDLGLPTAYAKDPWNRTLFYHSNITKRENPPFSASICFSHGSNCF